MKKIKLVSAAAAVAAAAAMMGVGASAYTGYIGFQSTLYSFRNFWDEASYGKATPWFDKFVVWGGNDPETFPDYEDYFDYDLEGYALDATYNDVEITEDGTYTVSAENMDWALDGASDFNLVFVSTDVPIDAGAVCTEAKIIVDGEVVKTVENPICDETHDVFNIMLANIYNSDVGGYGLAYPTSSLAVEFTITGLSGGDAAAEEEAPAETEAPAEETTAEETEAPAEETAEETEAAAEETIVQEDTAAPAETEAAPAAEVDAAPAETAPAPTAGDTQAPVVSTKASPNTGIEDVAVIAGLAVLAGAGIALTRKKK